MIATSTKDDLEERLSGCLCTSCEREGCKLRLDSLPISSLSIVDADKYKKCTRFKGKLCDFIIFYWTGGTKVAAVELKGGLVKEGQAQKQIDNGSKVAARVLGSHRVVDFFPILLHGRGLKRLQIDALQRVRVRFQGKGYMIIIERCGSQLADILRRYASK